MEQLLSTEFLPPPPPYRGFGSLAANFWTESSPITVNNTKDTNPVYIYPAQVRVQSNNMSVLGEVLQRREGNS